MQRIQHKLPQQPSHVRDSRRRRGRPDEYTIKEKKEIARLVVTPNARIECPRCADWSRAAATAVAAVSAGSAAWLSSL